MMLGVVCFTTVLVSAAVVVLSLPSEQSSATVGTLPLTATHEGFTDGTAMPGYTAWAGSPAIATNTYSDAVKIASASETYASPYAIQITISTSGASISNTDLSMTYLKGTGESYTSVGSFTVAGDAKSMTVIIPGDTNCTTSGQDYNFLITVGNAPVSGTYSIVYQAVQAS